MIKRRSTLLSWRFWTVLLVVQVFLQVWNTCIPAGWNRLLELVIVCWLSWKLARLAILADWEEYIEALEADFAAKRTWFFNEPAEVQAACADLWPRYEDATRFIIDGHTQALRDSTEHPPRLRDLWACLRRGKPV